jgi:type II secretory pathway pseudopilin PulG
MDRSDCTRVKILNSLFPRMPSRCSAEFGFSMVETLVVVGMVGIITLAIATAMTDMQKQTRALNEKLAQMEALRLLTAAFSQPKICKPL